MCEMGYTHSFRARDALRAKRARGARVARGGGGGGGEDGTQPPAASS